MCRMFFFFLFLSAAGACYAQTNNTDSAYVSPKFNSYQIYFKKPVKEIQEIEYHKDCTPVKGRIGEGQKTIIMDGYEPGNRIYMQIMYMDGTEEELVRSPCYIDPVIL